MCEKPGAMRWCFVMVDPCMYIISSAVRLWLQIWVQCVMYYMGYKWDVQIGMYSSVTPPHFPTLEGWAKIYFQWREGSCFVVGMMVFSVYCHSSFYRYVPIYPKQHSSILHWIDRPPSLLALIAVLFVCECKLKHSKHYVKAQYC
jgi:hypothetical protein